ncbi:hypothetical protein CYLTODRAFT_395184 [Cylindrobasidium torrendii FP15055 ss-10]|uniref:RlpA-like protein double-psi beta-barrel domain-containing protein n=1 Tax=Cylindrobasidium torrendii FP15055 ss-10 TaxID=1314674 RepID=A0A0D7BDP6_9AGAR|nr:hypothetical protein CYLTODRAFT_395184 [Cylindrobasidium torrendii FP15055 ss-10]
MHFSLSLLPILAAALSAFAHEPVLHNRHHEISKRSKGDVVLAKRFDNARWSFYDVGQGACGQVNVASDFIVALNSDQYGSGYPGPNCFKTISMTYNGKTTTATIMDQCPGCPYGGLDLSRGLFNFFADEGAGIIYGTWSFSDGSGSSTPTSTSQYTPPPTSSTYEAPSTTSTSTWTPPPTSSSSSSSSTSIWSSSSSLVTYAPSSSSSAMSSSAAPSSSAPANHVAGGGKTVSLNDNAPNNIYNVNGAIVNLANIAAQAQRIL